MLKIGKILILKLKKHKNGQKNIKIIGINIKKKKI